MISFFGVSDQRKILFILSDGDPTDDGCVGSIADELRTANGKLAQDFYSSSIKPLLQKI